MHEPATKTIHAAALDDAVATYLAEGKWDISTLVIRDAIEHGWHGATADIAERLEVIESIGGGPYDLLKAYRAMTEELKREVGA